MSRETIILPHDDTVIGRGSHLARSTIVIPAFPATGGGTSTAASPGFTWSRQGAVSAGTYLQNDAVVSSVAGRKCPFAGNITNIFVTSQNDDTFSITVQKRTGPGTYVNLITVSLTAQRAKTFNGLSVAVAVDDELAVILSAGSCSNVEVGVIIQS